MEEIEVGEYVRTKNGYIIKINEETIIFNVGYKEQYVDMESTIYGLPYEEEITKHSKNIIDLIEVGDFVNGELVREPIDKENGYNSDYTGLQQFLIAYGKIKTILTHEQYENNCYRLEE